jgi:hypothetical protein
MLRTTVKRRKQKLHQATTGCKEKTDLCEKARNRGGLKILHTVFERVHGNAPAFSIFLQLRQVLFDEWTHVLHPAFLLHLRLLRSRRRKKKVKEENSLITGAEEEQTQKRIAQTLIRQHKTLRKTRKRVTDSENNKKTKPEQERTRQTDNKRSQGRKAQHAPYFFEETTKQDKPHFTPAHQKKTQKRKKKIRKIIPKKESIKSKEIRYVLNSLGSKKLQNKKAQQS